MVRELKEQIAKAGEKIEALNEESERYESLYFASQEEVLVCTHEEWLLSNWMCIRTYVCVCL